MIRLNGDYVVILTSYDEDNNDDDDDDDNYDNDDHSYILNFCLTGSFRILNTHQLVSSKPETNASTTSLITFISSYDSYLSTIW